MINSYFNNFKMMFSCIKPNIIFSSTLLILLPIALISGPAIPDIFLSLIALHFLIVSIKNKLWKYYQNPIVIGFLIFSIYGILRSIFSDMPMASLANEGSVFYFRYIFFALGVWYLLDNNKYITKLMLIISIICLIIVCIDGLVQYLSGKDLFGMKTISPYRITGLFGNEPIMGRYIALISLFTFTLLYQNLKKSKIYLMASVVFLVMCEVIVFLSGERVPLFYITLFTILIVIFIPNYRLYRIIGFFISFAIILGILQLNPNAKERMVTQTLNEIQETKIQYLPYNKGYEEHYISAIKMFIDYPIFGIGTNTFRFQSQKSKYNSEVHDINSHPHHFYLQALAELGIIGFLFLASFFSYLSFMIVRQFYFIVKSNKSKQIPFEQFLFSMLLFTFWWPIIPHMSLYNNWNNVLLMLPLGFFMRNLYSKKNI